MPPSKVPAPDTGTGGGAHATSGAMSSVPLSARPNDASSSTRLTGPSATMVPSGNGTVSPLSTALLPSKASSPLAAPLVVS